ncbi:unnamed protein product [Blepharisma stoltei]|uniref:DUF1015 domain-containing protein n=1 Tax=Blepharisma stoltei TaxID=1481888 RepID=A0AAU9JDN2_9CILI|nr:unnamed protein product [Blepharisma stoltei]
MLSRLVKRTISISAFRGYIANPELAKYIISPPYDVLDSNEARIMAQNNKCSFLRVNKPEIELSPETDPYSEAVYLKGYENLQKFIRRGWLIREPVRRLYIYELTMNSRTQIGIVSESSIDDYSNNLIKKHELTRAKKEQDRTKLTETQKANVGPVFLTYKAKAEIDNIVQQIIQKKPHIDVTTNDEVRHRLWKCNTGENRKIIDEFKLIDKCYIADGHHRAASAYNVARKFKDQAIKEGKDITGDEDFNSFLSIHFPHNQLKIYDYNRVVKDLGGKSSKTLISELSSSFEVSEIIDPKPQRKHMFSMFLEGKWWGLRLKAEVNEQNPIERLDSQILTNLCLKPILGIDDLTKSDRIDFVGGIRGLKELEKRCHEDCQVAFALYPVDVEEVMAVADAGLIMPPKSTWFEPKPRSGLVVRVFDSK